MIEEFVDSVLIIDDKEDEIKDLKQSLEEKDIWVTYYNPPKEKQEIDNISQRYRNRKLIFLDLRIDEKKSTIDNISGIIRPLLKKVISNNFGTYGIVMWTKHKNHISEFKEKIQKDSTLYQLPLFVIQMDKSKYLKNGFENVIDDLEKELKNSVAANFFINWSNLINAGRDNSIKSIFELIPDYQKQDVNLEFLLFKMAISNSGIPIDKLKDFPFYKEAYKVFTELLSYEVMKNLSDDSNLFVSPEKINFSIDDNLVFINQDKYQLNGVEYNFYKLRKEVDDLKSKIKYLKEEEVNVSDIEKEKEEKYKLVKEIDKCNKEIFQLFSKINTVLLIDNAISTNKLHSPGNIYKIIDENNLLISSKRNSKDKIVAIEMTPPCDFANSKNDKPKLLGGFITKYSEGRIRELKSDSFYTEIYPVIIDESNEISLIVFDLKKITLVEEEDLNNNKKYKLIYRAKDKLFADILQKMSTYTARLGLPIIR